MLIFHSLRERRLWAWTALLVLAIYVSLPFMRSATDLVRGRGWLRALVTLALMAGAAAFAGWVIRQRPGWRRLLWLLPVAAVYGLVLSLAVAPEEQLHLIEYGGVGVLVYAALAERREARRRAGLDPGRLARYPALSAVLATTAAGWIDEGIQHLLPERYYDLRDVAFNGLAGLLAILVVTICSRQGEEESPSQGRSIS
jgi:VanZ family protein